jgi:hypothetical protein
MKTQISVPVLAAAILAALYALAPGAAAGAACVPANNIEAIVDDSISMTGTDPDANRVEALKILISKPGNAKTTLGALEFGSDQSYLNPPKPAADTLFPPEPIAANAAAMKSALQTNVVGDNGATDYNAAFALAATDNPSANARIFITDGGHDIGTYNNGHQGGPPTYVIGIGIGTPGSPTDFLGAATRLQQIASDTGGVYYPNVDSGNIDATMNQVDAALNCQAVNKTFTDQFNKVGQSKAKSLPIAASSKSVDLVLTWKSPLDQFTISNIVLQPKNGAAISIAKHLKIKRSTGKTFLDVHVSGLKKGKLKFKLKPLKLGSGNTAGVSLTTQATQGRGN